jgi:prepilin-type N-terminal cleavage/methylation domain-containing protein
MNRKGFSLLEVLLVTAVGLVVTIVAVPNVVVGLANARIRASMTSLSGAFQNCRMMAVKQNRTLTTHLAVKTYGLMAYIKNADDPNPNNILSNDPQVQLQAPVSQVPTPSGAGAPPEVDTAILGFIPLTSEPSFNSRGLPCTYSGGTCLNKGFIYYFKDNRPAPQTSWSAVSISPAGRIKKWYWNGSAWID